MATGLTPNYFLSYPLSTDPVNVAADIQELAEDLDVFLTSPSFINNINTNGGSITTPALTGNIFNANVATLNIGGAAITTNIGASAGQVNVRGNLNIASTKVYEINDITVLSASALGSGVVSSSLTTVGTITTGTWNATTIAVNKGGTGLTSYAIGDIIFASASTTLARLAGVATGNALISGGVGTAPSWGKIGLTTHVSGTLPVTNGGTGVTTSTGTGNVVLSASPTLTGTPLSTTASVDTNTTQIATTAFVINQAASALPATDGIAAVGTSFRYARQDHVHPTDITRAPRIPGVRVVSSSYELALLDIAGIIETNISDPNTITVPPESTLNFPVGSSVDIVQYGTGQTEILPGPGVTIRSDGDKLKIATRYSGVTLYKRGSDEWVLIGNLSS